MHIFGDSPYWQGAVERYVHAWFGASVDLVIYSYRALCFGMNKDDIIFDAAIADAVDTSARTRDVSIRSSGLDLYRSAPGKVVVATSLWLRPPPLSWLVCVPLPMRDGNELFIAVQAALRGDGGAPAAEEIAEYLAVPRANAQHMSRSEGSWK